MQTQAYGGDGGGEGTDSQVGEGKEEGSGRVSYGGVQKKAGAHKKPGQRSRFWSEEEHERFLYASKIYGYGNAQDIAAYVLPRTPTPTPYALHLGSVRLEQ